MEKKARKSKSPEQKCEESLKEAALLMKANAKAAVLSICDLAQNAQSESVRLAAAKEILLYAKPFEGEGSENAQVLRLIEGLRNALDGEGE